MYPKYLLVFFSSFSVHSAQHPTASRQTKTYQCLRSKKSACSLKNILLLTKHSLLLNHVMALCSKAPWTQKIPLCTKKMNCDWYAKKKKLYLKCHNGKNKRTKKKR